MNVYYRAQDEDVARVIKEAEYQVEEEIKPFWNNIEKKKIVYDVMSLNLQME